MRMFLSVTFCDLEKSTERSKTSRECWKIPLLSVCWLAAFSPPWFLLQTFSAADCKLISCRAAWLGVLVLDFFRSHPTQFESSLNKKQLRTDLFFVAQIAHSQAIHTMETPQFQMSNVYTPPPSTPNPLPKPNPQTFHSPTPEIHHSSPLRLGDLHQAQAQGIGHTQKALITRR